MPTYIEKVNRLNQLVRLAESNYTVALSRAASAGTTLPVRHKCFICYHGADIDDVTKFVENFSSVFIPRVLGASESDHFDDPVNSTVMEYIKSTIGSKYLSDSSVTILYVGKCTWSRKYVDWELSSTLRNDPKNKRSGLIAITPADRSTNQLPARFNDNYGSPDSSKGFARYYYYPSSTTVLRNCIEDAFANREARARLINNSRDLRIRDSPC